MTVTKRIIKKVISILLSICLVFSILVTSPTSLTVKANSISGDYQYYVDSGHATITKYLGHASNVSIPSKISSYPVLYIDSFAFAGSKSITNLIIPNSVTSINDAAFENCTSIANISIPNSITRIGSRAFNGCSSLKSVKLPNSITCIETSTFAFCSSLTNITIPNSVTELQSVVFNSCTSLKSIIIPSSVKIIGNDAFESCSSLTNVTIQYGVTNIDSYAFEGCTSLKNLSIPNSVTHIGSSAFGGCKSLNNVTIPNSITSINQWTFGACSSLKNITLPSSIKSIGDYAFSFSGLTNLTIPNGVSNLGQGVFFRCTSLTNVSIPKTVTSIGDYAFANCTALIKLPYLGSITKLNDHMFEDCTSITNVAIPNGIKSIGQWAFSGDYLISNISMPTSLKIIDDYAFYKCASINNLTIPNNVQSIDDYAFYDCSSLYNITIPNGTALGEIPFFGCGFTIHPKNLKQIQIYNIPSQELFATINGNNLVFSHLPVSAKNGGDVTISVDGCASHTYTNNTNDSLTYTLSSKMADGQYNIRFYVTQNSQTTDLDQDFSTFHISALKGTFTFDSLNFLLPNLMIAKSERTDKYVQEYFLQPDDMCQSNNANIINLANTITKDSSSSFEKAKVIHDWVANNIYYNFDELEEVIDNGPSSYADDAVSVLTNKRCVCYGYANITCALLRAVGIPAKVIVGTAFFNSHAWDEAFINGRWVIIDPTWDSNNRYQNGVFETQQQCGSYYFDPSIAFFSMSHFYQPLSPYMEKDSTIFDGTLKFNSQGGSLVSTYIGIDYGSKVNAPKVPTKPGYSFIGWYTEAYGGDKISFPYKLTTKATLYAHWVSFSKQNTTGVKLVKKTITSAKISWNAVSGASGYTIYMANKSTSKYSALTSTSSLSYTKTELTKGKTYYFKVVAYTMVNGKKLYNKNSSIVSIKM